MSQEYIFKYKIQIIIALVCLLSLIIAIYYIFEQKNLDKTGDKNISKNEIDGTSFSPELSISPTELQGIRTITVVPTIALYENGGLDLNSPIILRSKESILSLKNSLPYNKKFVSSQGVSIEILIPPFDLLENEWTLTTHIFGIDYQVPESDPEYQKNMYSFQEAAQEVYLFLQEHAISPSSIIIQWGDRAFIQDRSAEWLQGIN